jgi:heme/copper-type cytochrome/quinol oxidase subunit 2
VRKQTRTCTPALATQASFSPQNEDKLVDRGVASWRAAVVGGLFPFLLVAVVAIIIIVVVVLVLVVVPFRPTSRINNDEKRCSTNFPFFFFSQYC